MYLINFMTKKIYDPIKQPVSYAIVYGFVPELKELIIPYEFDYNRTKKTIRKICLDDKLKI